MLRVAPSLQAMSTFYKYFSMLRVAPSLQAMSTFYKYFSMLWCPSPTSYVNFL